MGVTTQFSRTFLLRFLVSKTHLHSMAPKEYTLIKEEEALDEAYTHHNDEAFGFSKWRQHICSIVSVGLMFSLATNAFFILLYFLHKPREIPSSKTTFGKVNLDLCENHVVND